MPRPRDWTHSWQRDWVLGFVIGLAFAAAGAVLAVVGIAAWHLVHAWLF
jgi:hypothetical protein